MSDSFTPSTPPEPPEGDHPVVRDRRRVDPVTGEVRPTPTPTPAGAGSPDGPDGGAAGGGAPGRSPADADAPDAGPAAGDADSAALLSAAESLAAERLDDLQRLQAEYVNYRRRVDRDREAVREGAVAAALEGLLPSLDDIHLARQHGDLEGGPFAAIAEKIESALGRLGLQRYGEVGEVFDPAVHEALMSGVDEAAAPGSPATVSQVLQPGYRVVGTGASVGAGRVIRPARVAVLGPA